MNRLLYDGNLHRLRAYDAHDGSRRIVVGVVRHIISTMMMMVVIMGHDVRPIAMSEMTAVVMVVMTMMMLGKSETGRADDQGDQPAV